MVSVISTLPRKIVLAPLDHTPDVVELVLFCKALLWVILSFVYRHSLEAGYLTEMESSCGTGKYLGLYFPFKLVSMLLAL